MKFIGYTVALLIISVGALFFNVISQHFGQDVTLYILGISFWLFGFVLASNGITIKLLDREPPSNYDNKRKDIWNKRFRQRYVIAWRRWWITLVFLAILWTAKYWLEVGTNGLGSTISIWVSGACLTVLLALTIVIIHEIITIHGIQESIHRESLEQERINKLNQRLTTPNGVDAQVTHIDKQ